MDPYRRNASQFQPWNNGPLNQSKQYYTHPRQYEQAHPGTTTFKPVTPPAMNMGSPYQPQVNAPYSNAGQDYGTEKTYESSYTDWMKQLTDYMGGTSQAQPFDWSGWLAKRPTIGGYNF